MKLSYIRFPVVALIGVLFLSGCSSGDSTSASSSSSPGSPPAPSPSPTRYQLNITALGSGTVTSSPTGINCGTTCSASFNAGTSVTLTATPASGYTFSGWSGACSGTANCVVVMNSAASTTATFTVITVTPPVPITGAPHVLYTDIVSGPTSSGEGNNGVYLSIFGKDFGSTGLGTTTTVKIGGVAVANYRYLGASKVVGIQQITVQVGALGGAAQGVALPIQVTVNGVASNTNVTFMPSPGRIFFIDNVTGNDSTGVPGDITKPYRHVQTTDIYAGGVWGLVQAGDIMVMRGHGNANPWTDIGFENYFMRFVNKSGSAPTGVSGTGAIVLTAYPGEDAYIRGTLAGGMTGGCVSAINGQNFVGKGQWVVVSNIRIDCEGYDGPISQEVYGDNWRVINNDLAASTAPRTGPNIPRMAGITGNGKNAVWYGNHIHDIQGSAQECHGIYIDGDGSYDIAYNYIHDIRDGNGFSVYVSGGNGSNEANNISLHHNLIHTVSKHGFNIGDNMHDNLKIWNNVVYNVMYAAVRFNTFTLSNAKIFNNTFYNIDMQGDASRPYGAISNDWNLPVGSLDIENNIFYMVTGMPYNSGSNGVPANAGTIAHNLWFNGSGSTSFDSVPVVANPLFVTLGSDFHLQAASPARAVGSTAAAVTSLVTTDYDFKARSSSSMDIGALKY